MGFLSIAPTLTQRNALGTGLKLIVDPYNYRRYIAFGSKAGLICDDVTVSSAVWRSINLKADNPPATKVNITYTYGTGPAFVHVGDQISLTSQSLAPGTDNATQQLFVTFDKCVQVTVIGIGSFSAWHCGSGGGCGPNNPWNYFDCNNVETDSPAYPTSSTPINIPASTCMTKLGASGGDAGTGGSGATYTLTVMIEALCEADGDQVFSDDMVGCLSAKGSFYWIGHRVVSGTDTLFCYRTTDYWQSVNTTAVAKYVGDMNYSVQVSSYHADKLYVSAGDPSGSDARVYYSGDGGVSFTSTGYVLFHTGGALNVPFNGVASLAVTANAGTVPAFMVVKGNDGHSHFRAINGTTVDLTSVVTGDRNFREFGMISTIINGLQINAVADDGGVYCSDTGGTLFFGAGSYVPAHGLVNGLTGLPNRGSSFIAFGSATLAFTNDRATTWTDSSTDYLAFAGSNWGTSGSNIAYACVQMVKFYSQSVTT